jgi:chemotaxis response regulator CheB
VETLQPASPWREFHVASPVGVDRPAEIESNWSTLDPGGEPQWAVGLPASPESEKADATESEKAKSLESERADATPGGAPEAVSPEARKESSDSASTSFPVVGIGASAGGLEALEELMRRLVTDSMAFIVLQHLAPSHESSLTEILARCTPMRVVTIRDRISLDPNVIYVAPRWSAAF